MNSHHTKKSLNSFLKQPIVIFFTLIFFELIYILINVGIIPILSVYFTMLEAGIICGYLFIINFSKKQKGKTFIILLFYILAFSLVLLIHRTAFEYFFTLSTLVSGCVLIFQCSSLKRSHIKYMIVTFLILFLIRFQFTSFGDRYLEMGVNQLNPNGMTFFLMTCSCFLFVLFLIKKKFLYLIFEVVLFYLQLLYMSRTSILVTILFMVVAALAYLRGWKFKKKGAIIALLLIIQIPLTYVYSITLFNAIGKGNLLILGKDIFTGREVIWSELYTSLSGHWMFGIGNSFVSSWYLNGELATNVHNSIMGIIANFGMIAFLAFIVAIVVIFKNKNCGIYTFIYFGGVLGISMFDTILISRDNVSLILIGLLCINSLENLGRIKLYERKKNSLLLVWKKPIARESYKLH